MALIKNDKVREQAIKHANFFHKRGTEANRQDIQIFESAVQFSESELQNLAIEFVEWVNILDAWRESTSEKWENIDGTIAKNSKDLFSKFIEQRNKP